MVVIQVVLQSRAVLDSFSGIECGLPLQQNADDLHGSECHT